MADPADLKVVPITSETVFDRASFRALGPTNLRLPEGDAFCTDAVSLTIVTGSTPDTGERFIVVVAVADHTDGRLGSLSPMTPTQARNFAASLIQGANAIDGGPRG